MSASKFNWAGAGLWLILAPAPFVFFVFVMALSAKAPGIVAAYSLVPYAAVVLAVGVLIKGKARWRSLRGLLGLPFVMTGVCGLAAILASGMTHGL